MIASDIKPGLDNPFLKNPSLAREIYSRIGVYTTEDSPWITPNESPLESWTLLDTDYYRERKLPYQITELISLHWDPYDNTEEVIREFFQNLADVSCITSLTIDSAPIKEDDSDFIDEEINITEHYSHKLIIKFHLDKANLNTTLSQLEVACENIGNTHTSKEKSLVIVKDCLEIRHKALDVGNFLLNNKDARVVRLLTEKYNLTSEEITWIATLRELETEGFIQINQIFFMEDFQFWQADIDILNYQFLKKTPFNLDTKTRTLLIGSAKINYPKDTQEYTTLSILLSEQGLLEREEFSRKEPSMVMGSPIYFDYLEQGLVEEKDIKKLKNKIEQINKRLKAENVLEFLKVKQVTHAKGTMPILEISIDENHYYYDKNLK